MKWFRRARRLDEDSTDEIAAARRRREEAHRARLAAEAETLPIRMETERLREHGRRNHFGESLLLGMRLRNGGA